MKRNEIGMVHCMLLLYPIGWGRHTFDNLYMDGKVDGKTLSLLLGKPLRDAILEDHGDGLLEEAQYDADLLNDWDDDADEDTIEECLRVLEGSTLTEKTIRDHWTIALDKETADIVWLHMMADQLRQRTDDASRWKWVTKDIISKNKWDNCEFTPETRPYVGGKQIASVSLSDGKLTLHGTDGNSTSEGDADPLAWGKVLGAVLAAMGV